MRQAASARPDRAVHRGFADRSIADTGMKPRKPGDGYRLARKSHRFGVHGADTRGIGMGFSTLPNHVEPPHATRVYPDAVVF